MRRDPRRSLVGWRGTVRAVPLGLLVIGLHAVARPAEPPVLVDVAAEAGIDFHFVTGSRGRHDLPEIMGGGVAMIDADRDGRLDLYLTNGGPIVPGTIEVDDSTCRLYRNVTPAPTASDPRPTLRFVDVTERANAPGPRYAMGTAVGDIDNDGDDDLVLTGWGGRRLYRNRGDGTFTDDTARAGLESDPDAWSTSAAFADLDRDGDLDLYVAHYVTYDPARAPFCSAPDGRPDYCGPEVFPAQADHVYRNNGDGTFTDVSAASGVASLRGRGLGVLAADLIGDELLDLYIANDGSPAFLFENLGGWRFREAGLAAGVAVEGSGRAPAGMGIALGDLDGDGRSDLVVGNLFGRGTLAFRALDRGLFRDESAAWGLTAATRGVTGFGLGLADFHGDGSLELLQANGHVLDRERLGEPFAMRTTLLSGFPGATVDLAAQSGSALASPILGRGLAIGDLDDDGRPDAVIARLDGPPLVLQNRSECAPLLVVKLVSTTGTPHGARVEVTHRGRTWCHDRPGGGSYLSASDPRIFVGGLDGERPDAIRVTWPSGRIERWDDVGPRRATLREGTGRESP